MVAFVSFQMPLYAVILAPNGASAAQIATDCSNAALFLTVSGRPYDLFLERCRRAFRLPATGQR